MSDVASEGPRIARQDEYEDILVLVDRCFSFARGHMAATFPHCYDSDRIDWHGVIVRDGTVVSHVACIPETWIVDGAELECWGISGVATDPRHRGNGYMSDLLDFWLDRMGERDVPISQLWGDRQRYGTFGWETAGRDATFTVNDRSFPDPPDRDDHVEYYDGSDAHLDLIEDVHSDVRYRVERNRTDHDSVLGQRGLDTLVYTEPGAEAYLAFKPERRSGDVREFAGADRGLRSLLSHLLRAYYVDEMTCSVHPSDPVASVLADVASDWTIETHKKVSVRDLPAVLDAFAGQMIRRWRSFDGGDGAVILGVEEDNDAARISWTDSEVAVDRVAGPPDIQFDRRGMTRFLFGFPDCVAGRTGVEPFLDGVLPLNFYVWRTEWV